MTAAPESDLTPELIKRVMKLSAESKDRLLGLLLDDPDEPPDAVVRASRRSTTWLGRLAP